MLRRLLPLVGLTLAPGLSLTASAHAVAPPSFTTVRLPGSDGQTESRVVVDPQDRRYVVSNLGQSTASAASFGNAAVWSSSNATDFKQTGDVLAGQTMPTIDVDIVAMRTGRLLASELDGGGNNFPTSYSDDQGKTWTASVGASLADEDRQWFAVGPDDPTTKLPTVYELWHNFASGFAQHNMWVQKSTDGGATFGAPVPVALPGSDAYSDLQCADSGGPSSIVVNQKTGRVYVVFTTRATPSDVGDTGGCGTATGGPIEFNIVAGTRVWVATSPDGSAGSWNDSLAQDDAASNRIVSMQLAYGALDTAGGFYVAFPESPRPYPDFSGAAVRYRYNDDPTLTKAWSPERTLIPDGGPGNLLTHIAAGDPGQLSVAYFAGSGTVDKPDWYAHVVTTHDGLSATPSTNDVQLADVPTYQATSANAMMGACAPAETGGAAGIYNGLACNRSTDVWGIALDHACRLLVTYPVYRSKTDTAPAGTYVSTQTGGASLCGTHDDAPAGDGAPTAGTPSSDPSSSTPTVNQVGTAPPADGVSAVLPTPAPATPMATLARRIKIQHLGGRAKALPHGRRITLRAKVVAGRATGVVALLVRVEGARRVTVAATRRKTTLGVKPRTLVLRLRAGARLVPGRYVTEVSGVIAGRRVVRSRPFHLR